MKKNDPLRGLQKLILSNEERMRSFGVQYIQELRFMADMSRSPLRNGEPAWKFARMLETRLNKMDFNRTLHGEEEHVPPFDPDTSVLIGHTVKRKLPVGIALNEIPQHIVGTGSTGCGKTTLFANLTAAIIKKVKVLLLDKKDEGGRYLRLCPDAAYIPPDKLRWNILSGAGNQQDYIRFLGTQFGRVSGMLPVTVNAVRANLLATCSDRKNLPAIGDLPQMFETLASRDGRSSLYTAARTFSDLAALLGDWSRVRQGYWPFDDHPLCVMPINGIPVAYENFIISLLHKYLVDQASTGGHTSELRRVILFEEGRTFFGTELETATGSGRVNLQAELLSLSRSFGLGICIGTQAISKIQSAVVENAGTFIAFHTHSETEARLCCRRLGLPEKRFREIMDLKVGEAWVITPSLHYPLKVKVPLIKLGDYPSRATLEKRMAPLYAKWDATTQFSPAMAQQKTTFDFREILGEINPEKSNPERADEPSEMAPSVHPAKPQSTDAPPILAEYFTLLKSAHENPDYSATAHYNVLGLSARRGNRIKAKIIELGWVEAVRVSARGAGRPKETLRLLSTGLEVLNESK